jgi:hypothetical protein
MAPPVERQVYKFPAPIRFGGRKRAPPSKNLSLLTVRLGHFGCGLLESVGLQFTSFTKRMIAADGDGADLSSPR